MYNDKEKRFNDSAKYINGGFNGIVKTLGDYHLLLKTKRLKEQLRKGDEFVFRLGDLDPFEGVHKFVENLAYQILGEPSSNFNPFKGRIDMFDPGTALQKSLKFIENAELDDYEKDQIKKVLLKDRYEYSAFYQLVDIYDDYISHVMFNVVNYLTDFSIEIDYRKKKFRQLLERLDTAIENNKDLDKNAPKHLTRYVAIMNPTFMELKRVLIKEFKEYLPKEEPINLGLSKQSQLADLIDGQKNLKTFYDYENKLYQKGYLNKEKNQWLKKAVLFIRFYSFCESKEMFKQKHLNKTTGVEILRGIYNFKEGKSMDSPSKRETKKNGFLGEYYFLDI